ncbi:hypothetical protein AmDm5_0746 [Acetobacter malorum]|nr:hypothetical protein AmDm5_0746 [Acetobacter malorum]
MHGAPTRHESVFNVGNTSTKKLGEADMLLGLPPFLHW